MSEKQITLITVIILGVVLLGGAAGVWYLYFNVLEDAKKEVEVLKKKVAADLKKQKAIPGLKIKLAEKEREAAEKVLQIPDFGKQEYDRFINTIEDLKRKAGIQIWSAQEVLQRRGVARRGQGGAAQLPPDVHRVDYEMTCNGEFFPLLRFLNLLETDTRFISVEGCTISVPTTAGAVETGALVREMKLRISTYSYTTKALFGKKDKEPPSRVINSTPLPE